MFSCLDTIPAGCDGRTERRRRCSSKDRAMLCVAGKREALFETSCSLTARFDRKPKLACRVVHVKLTIRHGRTFWWAFLMEMENTLSRYQSKPYETCYSTMWTLLPLKPHIHVRSQTKSHKNLKLHNVSVVRHTRK